MSRAGGQRAARLQNGKRREHEEEISTSVVVVVWEIENLKNDAPVWR